MRSVTKREDAKEVSENEVDEYELYEVVPPKVIWVSIQAFPWSDPPTEHVWEDREWDRAGRRPKVEVFETDMWATCPDGNNRLVRDKYLRAVGTDHALVRKAFRDRVAQLRAAAEGIA
jgi:hypothetical protein